MVEENHLLSLLGLSFFNFSSFLTFCLSFVILTSETRKRFHKNQLFQKKMKVKNIPKISLHNTSYAILNFIIFAHLKILYLN